MDIVCFHNADEENGYLSNWYMSGFEVDGISFSSMEQYMMYKKAICFKDIETARKILQTDDTAQIKTLGRGIQGYCDNIWSGMRQIIVYEGLNAKFLQNNLLKKQLLDTQDKILAECAVKDCIWGIGLSMNDPKRLHIEQWRGQNLLGYSLMLVRDRVK